MEIYQLNSFIAVADTANLTRASKAVNLSISAMSSQIKALEDELGLELFTRDPRGMVLTDNGRELLKEAVKVVQASSEMKNRAAVLREKVSGKLNIGINTDPVFLGISDIRERLLSSMPDVKLSFIESQTFETFEKLSHEEIDAGFHFGPAEDPSIFSMKLMPARICVVIPSCMAEGKEDAPLEIISSLPWVWTRYGCPFHAELRKDLAKKNLSLNQVTDAVDEGIVRELVRAGTGAALMRKDEALSLVEQGAAVIWRGVEITVWLAVASLEKRRNERIISSFMKMMVEKYKSVKMS